MTFASKEQRDAHHQDLEQVSIYFYREIHRLLSLDGNCGRVVRRFIEQSFPAGTLLYRMPVYGDPSHPHFPVVLAEAAVLLEQAVIDAHKAFPDEELETFFSVIALEPVVLAESDLTVRIDLKEMPETLADKRALLSSLVRLLEYLEASIRFGAHTLYALPRFNAPDQVSELIRYGIEGLIAYEGDDPEAYYEKQLALFLQAYAGDTRNALHLPGRSLSAIRLLNPTAYAQIEQIFEMERQQELEAEALAS